MSRAIVWFRNDLRTADNEALYRAAREHDEVLPLYLMREVDEGITALGMPRMGPFRSAFRKQAMLDLDEALCARGSCLRVEKGDPVEVLLRLIDEWQVEAVHVEQAFAWEEQEEERVLSERIEVIRTAPSTLLHPDDLPFSLDRTPEVFTSFRHKVEKDMQVREPLEAPIALRTSASWRDLNALEVIVAPRSDPRAVMEFHGSRQAGLQRVQHYIWENRAIAHYKATRNDLLGADFSSKFSPWLACGALSAREVYREVERYEEQYGADEHSYWLVFELLWRDHFHFTAARLGPAFFGKEFAGISLQSDALKRWMEGRTGQPFVDANMRELSCTGWMSNRGRQNVASYLVHELGVDHRLGAWWFEHLLIDHDPCSNWGNWRYIARQGRGGRGDRPFDVAWQQQRYDPEGKYVAHWAAH
ncbi:MAG: DASH family cryptochrome [Flavobacteriales bacterium]|nr:DASH family cryptochrome [Flavobacteriales bacterium]